MTNELHAPETKSDGEASAAFTEFMRGYESWREGNDARLAEIETRLSADVLTEEKVARMEQAMDESKRRYDRMTLEHRRPRLEAPAGESRDPALSEHKAAFDVVNIDRWIADEVETTFAEQESAAFVNGDGINKPKGFLASPTVVNTSWAWGSLGVVGTGALGAFPADDPSDILVDLVYALKAGYRQNAAFVMNRKTQSVIRKFKDAGGNYLWQPPAAVGQPATLMSFPVIETEDMPDIADNSLSVAFGDFRRGYLVVDRTGVRVLRDPYSAKPYVLFYTTKRVGGGVQDYDAIKLLKFA